MDLYVRDYEKPTKHELEAIEEQNEFFKLGIISPEHIDPINKYDSEVRDFVCHYRKKFPNNVIWSDELDKVAAKKEAEAFIKVLDKSRTESDIQNYIKRNRKWFIPASILKEYNFGHKENYLFPEMMLGKTYKVDYVICGRNSDGFHLLLVEFENANTSFIKKYGNGTSESVTEGYGQIFNWKIWMNENLQLFLNEFQFTKKGIYIPISRIHYCLVVSRRKFMNDSARDRKNSLISDTKELNIINYDRICDYISALGSGYCLL